MSKAQHKISYEVHSAEPPGDLPSSDQGERNLKAAALIRAWMNEKDGYDDEIWPLVEEELKDIQTRFREK